MKSLLLLFLALSFSFNLFAADMDVFTFYQPQYKIVSAGPICPTQDGGIRCMAIGTVIKMKATLNGCLDKVDYVNVQKVVKDEIVHIYITAVAKFNPRNIVVRCAKIPEDYQTIILPREDYADFNLKNLKIHYQQ